MLQPKDTDWINVYKDKTHIYIYIYIYTHTHGLQEMHFRPKHIETESERMQMESKRKLE